MGWESREGSSNKYYTRSRRVGGRVVREYVGCGPAAETIALVDAEERRLRKERDERLREQVAKGRAVDQELRDDGKLCDLLIQLVLWKASYYKHRGEWRKRRVQTRVDAGSACS